MADQEKPRRRRRAERVEEEEAPPAKKRPTEPLPQLEERGPRQSLLLGGALLLVGLAIVGTDSGGMGSVVALVGLASIIYGIHAFGRLGSEDMTPGSVAEVARSTSKVQLVLGLVIAVVGLAATIAAWFRSDTALRRSRRALLDLSDEQLRDVGLSRPQALAEARRSLYLD